MTVDLVGEFTSARDSIAPEHRAALRAAEIPAILVDVWGLFGVSSVAVDREYYQPATGGPTAFIAPVRGDLSLQHPDPAGLVLFGDIIDLLCWHPARPDRWALRLGSATALGAFPPQLLRPPPVRVHATPLGWFRSGGTGLSLLTRRRREIQSVLLSLHHIVADDPAHRRRLLQICRLPYPTPAISLAGTCQEHYREPVASAAPAVEQTTTLSEA